jgi:hypothetical protein
MTAMILIAITLAGTLLLLRGLRGRRVGDTPYCPKCGYDLTGLTSQRCPECGRDFTPETILHGRRHPRPVAITFGLILLAVGFVCLTVVQHNLRINWRRHVPAASLFRLNDIGDASALYEVRRRYALGILKSSQVHRFTETLLELQQRDVERRSTMLSPSLHMLEAMHDSGQLTDDQRRRFTMNLGSEPNLSIRTPIRAGDPIPCRLTHWQCIPSGAWDVWHRPQLLLIENRQTGQDWWLDGEDVIKQRSRRTPGQVAGPIDHDFALSANLEPGVYDVQALVHRGLLRKFAPYPDSLQTAEVAAQFEVISPNGKDTVQLITTNEAREDLELCISYLITPVPMVDNAGNSRSVQQVSFRALWPLCLGVACDVFAFDGFREHEAGQLWCAPGDAELVFARISQMDWS